MMLEYQNYHEIYREPDPNEVEPKVLFSEKFEKSGLFGSERYLKWNSQKQITYWTNGLTVKTLKYASQVF